MSSFEPICSHLYLLFLSVLHFNLPFLSLKFWTVSERKREWKREQYILFMSHFFYPSSDSLLSNDKLSNGLRSKVQNKHRNHEFLFHLQLFYYVIVNVLPWDLVFSNFALNLPNLAKSQLHHSLTTPFSLVAL